MKLVPKNWNEFQHYKNRCPPWIRLHRKLLDDREFQRLPVASRALAPMLWLLASESKEGVFDGSVDELSFRLRSSEREIEAGLKSLIEKGFFVEVQGASNVLAERVQPATDSCSETEGETETDQRQKEPTVLSDLPVAAYRIPNCPFDEIVKAYHDTCPTLPRLAVVSDTRKKHIASRWKEVCGKEHYSLESGLEWFRDFFKVVANSAFLSGQGKPNRQTGRVWAADFDWLMLPTNFVKVVEGRYDNRKAA